jgi:predicted ATPase
VTLIGPGGVGKTRLLGEIGLRLRAARPDRPVVMCELATATEESAVDAVAEALGIEGRPGVGLADRVAAALADTEIVVLLDNCEHVLDPIAALVELLLARCRNATVVTTSRERLRVPAERLCPVPALSSADDDAPAVRLFVERARAVAPAFEPDRGEVSVVGEIVRRLDGLPLATVRCMRLCRGRSSCSMRRCDELSSICRCSRGRSRPEMRRRSAASTPTRSPPRWTSWSSAPSSCGPPTGAT